MAPSHLQSGSTFSLVSFSLLDPLSVNGVTGSQIAFFSFHKMSSDSSSLHFEGGTMKAFKLSPRGPRINTLTSVALPPVPKFQTNY